MADLVFILGAGASKEAGVPTMPEFIDAARSLLRKGDVGNFQHDFERFVSSVATLQKVHSKAQLDIHNIESVFAALEMAKTLRRGDLFDDIESVLSSVRRVIMHTIQATLLFPVRSQSAGPPKTHRRFFELCQWLASENRPRASVAVITLNYDLAVDYAFHFAGKGVDYGLSDEPTGFMPLLKLHGSLNWAKCPQCRAIVVWKLSDYFNRYSWNLEPNVTAVRLELGSQINNLRHCEKGLPEPFLVPPTWNKGDYYAAISPVWARAARELSEAESIISIGFSLPETDWFFRYLYGLGTVGDKPILRFWVFDPDRTGAVERRYTGLLGPGTVARFEYFQKTFAESIDIIKARLSGQ